MVLICCICSTIFVNVVLLSMTATVYFWLAILSVGGGKDNQTVSPEAEPPPTVPTYLPQDSSSNCGQPRWRSLYYVSDTRNWTRQTTQ
ncbi:hypothetical protein GDO81_028448 [Engystomops pustulosus]|uniref:Secreted protein n=1 Tax=Engystomops pustulosus TaxID=76066 RepID=A0AAV6YN95_ENGPU|nr:hypothetical protein GDO81_028448 [Engystomops pustulosus]